MWSDVAAWVQEIQAGAAVLRDGAAVAGEGELDCPCDRRARVAARSGGVFGGDDVVDRVVIPILYRVTSLPRGQSGVDASTRVDELYGRRPWVPTPSTHACCSEFCVKADAC